MSEVQSTPSSPGGSVVGNEQFTETHEEASSPEGSIAGDSVFDEQFSENQGPTSEFPVLSAMIINAVNRSGYAESCEVGAMVNFQHRQLPGYTEYSGLIDLNSETAPASNVRFTVTDSDATNEPESVKLEWCPVQTLPDNSSYHTIHKMCKELGRVHSRGPGYSEGAGTEVEVEGTDTEVEIEVEVEK